VTVDSDGRATKLVGDKRHPFTRGGLCAKVNSYLEDRVYNPDRLLFPLRRSGPKGGGEFERISWDEALQTIAARWREIIEASGAEAILPYSYMGTQGMVHGMSMHARSSRTWARRAWSGRSAATTAGTASPRRLASTPASIRRISSTAG